MLFINIILDEMGIEKTYVLGTSAGGVCALKFAMLYPERTKGVILYCSGAVPAEKIPEEKELKYAAVPEFVCNDFSLWMMGPIIRRQMNMTSEVWHTIFPVGKKVKGVVNDGYEVNLDGQNHYEDYDFANFEVPVLALHAKDDKVADYKSLEAMVNKIANAELVVFEKGGHMMTGNGAEIAERLQSFVERNK